MVKLYHIIAWLLFGQLAVASTQNASLSIIPGQDSHNRVKRWFSLQKPNEGGVNGGRGTWPAMCPGSDRPAQVISYCFEDQRSERRLKDLLNHAVAGWALALYPHSSLEIDLDNAQSTICSNSNRPDALHIIDNSRDNDDRWNFSPQCRTAASLGYLYGSDARGRHHLDFCALAPGFEEESKPFALADMIHELGHVMGLQHEHQRDDAYKYLDYKCSNLLGYQAGVNAAMADPARIFDPPYAWSREQRVFAICHRFHYSNIYLPIARDFTIDTAFMGWDVDNDGKFRDLVASRKFDYFSIMMYSSDFGAAGPPTSADNWVISRRDTGESVWQGGSEDPQFRRISFGDVARVAQLYPTPDGWQRFAGGPGWQLGEGQQPGASRVRIRDELDVVVPPPRRADEGSGEGDWADLYNGLYR